MLQKEAVKSRMDEGISFTEFAYMLVQAYDFAHLARTRGCELQVGGSDQWGNITAGIELAARRDDHKLHGLVLPLLTTSSGAKFGKSEAGQRLARSGQNVGLRVPPVLAARRRRRRGTTAPLLHVPAARRYRHHHGGTRRRSWQARCAAAAGGRRDRTDSRHGHGAPRHRRRRRSSSAAATCARQDAGDAGAGGRRRCRRSRSRRGALASGLPIADALVAAGLASSKGDARRGLGAERLLGQRRRGDAEDAGAHR